MARVEDKVVRIALAGASGGLIVAICAGIACGGVVGVAGITTIDESIGGIVSDVMRSKAWLTLSDSAARFRITFVAIFAVAAALVLSINRRRGAFRLFWTWWHLAVLVWGVEGLLMAFEYHYHIYYSGGFGIGPPLARVLTGVFAQLFALVAMLIVAGTVAFVFGARYRSWPLDSRCLLQSLVVVLLVVIHWGYMIFFYSGFHSGPAVSPLPIQAM